jgi:hypothetical protein
MYATRESQKITRRQALTMLLAGGAGLVTLNTIGRLTARDSNLSNVSTTTKKNMAIEDTKPFVISF